MPVKSHSPSKQSDFSIASFPNTSLISTTRDPSPTNITSGYYYQDKSAPLDNNDDNIPSQQSSNSSDKEEISNELSNLNINLRVTTPEPYQQSIHTPDFSKIDMSPTKSPIQSTSTSSSPKSPKRKPIKRRPVGNTLEIPGQSSPKSIQNDFSKLSDTLVTPTISNSSYQSFHSPVGGSNNSDIYSSASDNLNHESEISDNRSDMNQPSMKPRRWKPISFPDNDRDLSLPSPKKEMHNLDSQYTRRDSNNNNHIVTQYPNMSSNSRIPSLGSVPKRSSLIYLESKNKTPNFSTPSSYRFSMQFPPGVDLEQELAKMRPNPAKQRPLSYMDPASATQTQELDEPESQNNYNDALQARTPNSVATGMTNPATPLDRPARLWKYHIQKNLKDFYMTTNPDTDHLNAPKAQSYYVNVTLGEKNCYGQTRFSLSLIDPIKQFCEITVKREFSKGNEEEYFEVIVYNKKEEVEHENEFDFSSRNSPMNTPKLDFGDFSKEQQKLHEFANNGFTGEDEYLVKNQMSSVVAWKGVATSLIAARHEQQSPSSNKFFGSSSSNPRLETFKQFSLTDDRGRRWVIGNRMDHFEKLDNQEDIDEDGDEDESAENGNTGSVVRKKSRKVYFFIPGMGGPETDKVLAVLQRRKQMHKRIAKDISKFTHKTAHSISSTYEALIDDDKHKRDNATASGGSSLTKALVSPSKRGFFRNLGPNVGVSYGEIPDDPLELKDSQSSDKFGWLTLYESVKKRPGLWPIVTGTTLAVAYAQKIDNKERSFPELMKKFGRKYKEGRLQVYNSQQQHHHSHHQSLSKPL